jgi:hypothetical protein
MVARHSKQIPIPQSGPRASPLTEVRHACPEIIIAAATVVSVATEICRPFTVIVISPGMISLAMILLTNARVPSRFDWANMAQSESPASRP